MSSTTMSPVHFYIGTCESLFSFESNLESNRPYITQAVTQPAVVPYCLLHLQRILNPSVFCICDEQEWCTDYGYPNWVLVYFNSVI